MSSLQALELAGTVPETAQQLGSQFIVADIGGAPYGIGVEQLLEVEYVPKIAPIPHAEDWLLGVVNLRGSILTLIDPAQLLDIGGWSRTPQARMLVVGREDPVALTISRLRGMRQFADPVAPELVNRLPGRVDQYARTIYRDGEQFMPMLDIERMLDDADQASSRSNEMRPAPSGLTTADHFLIAERGES